MDVMYWDRGLANSSNVRKIAVLVLLSVHNEGFSLTRQIARHSQLLRKNEQSLLMEICYGSLRWDIQLQRILDKLMEKPLRRKDSDISLLIKTGLYQLHHMRVVEYAAVQETVNVTSQLNKKWAKGVVNAVLRRYIRDKNQILQSLKRDELFNLSFPAWMVELFRRDWPNDWEQIIKASNTRPPMVLRVNHNINTTQNYLKRLEDAGISATCSEIVDTAIILDNPTDVVNLPGFDSGSASVQDIGAQLAAKLLKPKPGELLLDACAAPGGKTGHLLECVKEVELIAIDSEPDRCKLIEDNLQRLHLRTKVISADASKPNDWWNGRLFDAILADVPCSALGVIRRHPDIKVLRKMEDIKALQRIQLSIICALWPLLKPGGRMLYCTCSVLKDENDRQIERFLSTHKDAESINIKAKWGVPQTNGRQLLSGMHHVDGFYYALLHKL